MKSNKKSSAAPLHRHCPDPIWIVDDCSFVYLLHAKKALSYCRCNAKELFSYLLYAIFFESSCRIFQFSACHDSSFYYFFLFHSYMFFLISFIYMISITRLCIIAAAESDPVFPAFPLPPAASLHKPQRLFPHVDRCRFS